MAQHPGNIIMHMHRKETIHIWKRYNQVFTGTLGDRSMGKFFLLLCIFSLSPSLFFFFLAMHGSVHRLLAPQPGIGPTHPAVGVGILNPWTSREVPLLCFSVANTKHITCSFKT